MVCYQDPWWSPSYVVEFRCSSSPLFFFCDQISRSCIIRHRLAGHTLLTWISLEILPCRVSLAESPSDDDFMLLKNNAVHSSKSFMKLDDFILAHCTVENESSFRRIFFFFGASIFRRENLELNNFFKKSNIFWRKI